MYSFIPQNIHINGLLSNCMPNRQTTQAINKDLKLTQTLTLGLKFDFI